MLTWAERLRRERGSLRRPDRVVTAPDHTMKAVFVTGDGHCETVVMPRARGGHTVCLSTATGCSMGCRFCRTGQLGAGSELTDDLMLAQVVWAIEAAQGDLRRAVFMGMGEPLLNLAALDRGLAHLRHQPAPGLAATAITVSTVGVLPGIDRLPGWGRRLRPALSLHCALPDKRRWLLPAAEARWPLAQLRAAVAAYPLPPNARFMIEVALARDFNDGDDDLAALIDWCRGLPVKVNLIPLSPVAGFPYPGTTADRLEQFVGALTGAGIAAHVRRSLGGEVGASCGALGGPPGPQTTAQEANP